MRDGNQLSGELQNALSNGLLKRIPLTFLPFVNQQLNQWEFLFPNERQSTERLLLYVASLSPEQSAGLFRNLVELEEKMGVRNWQFATNEQTIKNSSQLASSPYFQDWRRAVQAVFDAADAHALKTNGAPAASPNRLVLLDLPATLPVDAASVWHRWQGIGRTVKLDLAQSTSAHNSFQLLLGGAPNAAGARSGGCWILPGTAPQTRQPIPGWWMPAESWLMTSWHKSLPVHLKRELSFSAMKGWINSGRVSRTK